MTNTEAFLRPENGPVGKADAGFYPVGDDEQIGFLIGPERRVLGLIQLNIEADYPVLDGGQDLGDHALERVVVQAQNDPLSGKKPARIGVGSGTHSAKTAQVGQFGQDIPSLTTIPVCSCTQVSTPGRSATTWAIFNLWLSSARFFSSIWAWISDSLRLAPIDCLL